MAPSVESPSRLAKPAMQVARQHEELEAEEEDEQVLAAGDEHPAAMAKSSVAANSAMGRRAAPGSRVRRAGSAGRSR